MISKHIKTIATASVLIRALTLSAYVGAPQSVHVRCPIADLHVGQAQGHGVGSTAWAALFP